MSKVCVFAGAGGSESTVISAAKQIGADLASAGVTVLYGGSSRGVMGALYDGVKSKDGHIIGVLPERIAALKHYPDGMELVTTKDMPSRKEHFWACDAFVCLPGGVGTLDELFEIWSLSKLGFTEQKPIIVYNHNGFFHHLEQLIKDMVRAGFMPQERADMVKFVSKPGSVVKELLKPHVAQVEVGSAESLLAASNGEAIG